MGVDIPPPPHPLEFHSIIGPYLLPIHQKQFGLNLDSIRKLHYISAHMQKSVTVQSESYFIYMIQIYRIKVLIDSEQFYTCHLFLLASFLLYLIYLTRSKIFPTPL